MEWEFPWKDRPACLRLLAMNPRSISLLTGYLLCVACFPKVVLHALPDSSPTVTPIVPKRPQSPVEPVTQAGNGYDWMARHEAALALKSTLNPDVVFIGDSITHHWGGLPEGRLKLGEKVLKSAFPNHRILNLGFGSDRTQHVLWRLDHGELT